MPEQHWVFGYGSLIWRPSFPWLERCPACLRGWMRRFWQGSPDHRGVPCAPGRVVTLIRDPAGCCWGMAYRLDPDTARGVMATLDHRERGGYTRERFMLDLQDGRRARATSYVASASNANYLGPAPLADIAAQVRGARGPSGSNLDYVRRLAQAIRAMDVEDDHLFDLARLLEPGGNVPPCTTVSGGVEHGDVP